MLKTEAGQYIRTKASKQTNGAFILERLYITLYNDNNFSSCQSYSMGGKCQSCSEKAIEYQGECFEKIEGCLIQPGSLCVKCDSDYLITSDYKCYKECYSLFAWTLIISIIIWNLFRSIRRLTIKDTVYIEYSKHKLQLLAILKTALLFPSRKSLRPLSRKSNCHSIPPHSE